MAEDIVTIAEARLGSGGRNLSYDLTGSKSDFADFQYFVLYKKDQVIKLRTPAWTDTITVTNCDTNQEMSVDVSGAGDCTPIVDETAMGILFDIWSDPNSSPSTSDISSSLKFTCNVTSKIKIRVDYQRMFANLAGTVDFNGDGPAYSPSLMKWVLEQLDSLKHLSYREKADLFGTSTDPSDILNEDLTGESPDNYIAYEKHYVNSTSGQILIAPQRGSFYPNKFSMRAYKSSSGQLTQHNAAEHYTNGCFFEFQDETYSHVNGTVTPIVYDKIVELTERNYEQYLGKSGIFYDKLSNVELVCGEDYEFVDINLAKTERSESIHGVYDHIRFKKAIHGYLIISYQAFGGQVVPDDVRDIRKDLSNAMSILGKTNLLTVSSIEHHPIIKNLFARLEKMEDCHNHFGRVEHLVYTQRTGFHWINIAEIYDVAWDRAFEDPGEIGTFRVESTLRKWCFEFVVSCDVKRSLRNALRCKMLGSNGVQIDEFQNYYKLAEANDVAIRLCWIGDGSTSGVVLQLGWNYNLYGSSAELNGVNTDSIIVTNKSGMTSKWKLCYNPLDVTPSTDNSVRIYNHTMFVRSTATTFAAGTQYFEMVPKYAYFKTTSSEILSGVEYYKMSTDPITGKTDYVKQSGYSIGTSISTIPVELFERRIYDRYPQLISNPSGPTAGKEVYEIILDAHSEDSIFTMPNRKICWIGGTSQQSDYYTKTYDTFYVPNKQYYIKGENNTYTAVETPQDMTPIPSDRVLYCLVSIQSKYAVRMLEPDGGLIAWAGSIPLAQYAAGPDHGSSVLKTQALLSDETQSIIGIDSITSATIDLYDRKTDRYFNKTIEMNIDSTASNLVSYGSSILYLEDMLSVELRIKKNTVVNDGTRMLMEMDVCMGTASVINDRFDLRQIRLHF